MNDQKNLILAIVASVLIMVGFQYFVEKPKLDKTRQQQTQPVATTPGAVPAAVPQAIPGTPAASAAVYILLFRSAQNSFPTTAIVDTGR